MPPFWTVKSPAGCKAFATVMRGGPLAAMALLVLIVPDTAVSASPRQQSPRGICARTQEVQDAILAAIRIGTCSTVTDTQLAAIVALSISSYTASSIVPANFAGLTGLCALTIRNSPTLNTVPANAFSQVATALERLDLDDNSISTIDEDAFDGLTALEKLSLFDNSLTTLDEDIFDGLTALIQILLRNNNITALDVAGQSTVMVSNLGEAEAKRSQRNQVAVDVGQAYAYSFHTGSTAVTLEKVRLHLRGARSAPAASIRADSSGQPGATLHVLTTPSIDEEKATLWNGSAVAVVSLGSDQRDLPRKTPTP